MPIARAGQDLNLDQDGGDDDLSVGRILEMAEEGRLLLEFDEEEEGEEVVVVVDNSTGGADADAGGNGGGGFDYEAYEAADAVVADSPRSGAGAGAGAGAGVSRSASSACSARTSNSNSNDGPSYYAVECMMYDGGEESDALSPPRRHRGASSSSLVDIGEGAGAGAGTSSMDAASLSSISPSASSDRRFVPPEQVVVGAGVVPGGDGEMQQQQQQRSPRPAAQRRTNRYRTARIAGVGIRQGLRRTGRLFARGGGRRRRSAAAADGADDSDGDGDDSGENCVGREAMAGGNRDGRRDIPVGEQYFGHGDGGDTRRTNGYSARNINAGEDPSPTQRSDGLGLGSGPNGLDETTATVRAIESTLRYILVVLGSYMLGASRPALAPFVSKAIELGGAAWATCAIILVLAAYRGRGGEVMMQTSGSEDFGRRAYVAARLSEDAMRIEAVNDARPTEATPLLDNSREDRVEASPSPVGKSGRIESGPADLPTSTQMPHPELEALHLVDCASARRIIPSEVVVLDNDLFRGKLLAMIRTSDADNDPELSSQTSFSATHQAVSNYLRPKQRRFEFQFQLKFKKIPSGPLFLACEVDEAVKMGMVQRAFVGACLNFVKKMNSGFHSCLTGQEGTSMDDSSGRYEKTHIAFKVDASMDALVATRPGDPLPKLGEAIQEAPESLRYRKRGGKIDWNIEDTYTMGLW